MRLVYIAKFKQIYGEMCMFHVLCGFMMFLLPFIVYLEPENAVAGGICHECCEKKMNSFIYD